MDDYEKMGVQGGSKKVFGALVVLVSVLGILGVVVYCALFT